MTWRERTVIRILLLVARIVNDDATLTREIQALAAHIEVHGGRAEP